MAAVLACGGGPNQARSILDRWGAALSHRAAACLWGLLPMRDGPIDVTVAGKGGRKRRRGIRVHRCPSLLGIDVTLHRGIPVTSPARTVADLRLWSTRGGIPGNDLRRSVRQAEVLGLPLGRDTVRDRTRSDLERDFLRLCRRHRLPDPEVNVRVGEHLVDFLWPKRRLVVETDGFRYHRGAQDLRG